MRRAFICALALSALAGLTMSSGAGAARGEQTRYVVLYKQGASAAQAQKAIEAAGGRVVQVNKAIGVGSVVSSNPGFAAAVAAKGAIAGAARDQVIGHAPGAKPRAIETEVGGPLGTNHTTATAPRSARAGAAADALTADPLAPLQWDMRMIHATVDGSYAVNQGSKDVLVGVMDTGIDGSHPDIAPNFNAGLSRNFTEDIEIIDGPCDNPEPDPCKDPADVDDDGHGTHVASTIGSPLNGIGMAGVAPNVSLVNIRAGQDSGFFFLQPTLDAMVYAGDTGIDVVNMSFFVDPWLYNCASNPADSPAQQAEQRTIVKAVQRAVNYAMHRGVTFVSAAGNDDDDLGAPEPDTISPDFPEGTAHDRIITRGCVSVPTETEGVIPVSAVGPSGRKAYYSNYGLEQIEVSAPGGDRREFVGTPRYNAPDTRILAAYPKSVGLAAGTIDPATGEPTTDLVVRDAGNPDAYYQYIQGTSMASPHAVGVAALIVSQFGRPDARHGGLTMNPLNVRKQLLIRAQDTPCPTPRLFHYDDPALPAEQFDALCEGGKKFNGFYGQGIVDALASLSRP